MVTLIIFGEIVVIWDSNEDGKIQIGIGKCKDPSLGSIYDVGGVENYIVIYIIFVFEHFEQQKLLCLTPVAKYCSSLVGNDCFWLARDVLLIEDAPLLLPQEDILHEGFNNMQKRPMFYMNQLFFLTLHIGDLNDNEEIDNKMDEDANDKFNGYKSYNSNDARETSLGITFFYSMSEARNERQNKERNNE